MSRKVYIKIEGSLIITLEEGVEVGEAVGEVFEQVGGICTENVMVEDFTVDNHEVTDSK